LQDFTTTDTRVAFSYNADPAAYGVLLLQLNPTHAIFSYHSTNGSVLDSGVIQCVDPSIQTLAKDLSSLNLSLIFFRASRPLAVPWLLLYEREEARVEKNIQP